ncbi:MAG: hypothetical protein WB554_17305, partial [Desulfomonilaceae bacterium]
NLTCETNVTKLPQYVIFLQTLIGIWTFVKGGSVLLNAYHTSKVKNELPGIELKNAVGDVTVC